MATTAKIIYAGVYRVQVELGELPFPYGSFAPHDLMQPLAFDCLFDPTSGSLLFFPEDTASHEVPVPPGIKENLVFIGKCHLTADGFVRLPTIYLNQFVAHSSFPAILDGRLSYFQLRPEAVREPGSDDASTRYAPFILR